MVALQRSVPEFSPVIDRFLQLCHIKHYPPRSVIIHAGDPPETLYFITRGAVTVMIEDKDGHEMVLAYLNKGEFFGEMGLFDEKARSAWVVAKGECEVDRKSVV